MPGRINRQSSAARQPVEHTSGLRQDDSRTGGVATVDESRAPLSRRLWRAIWRRNPSTENVANNPHERPIAQRYGLAQVPLILEGKQDSLRYSSSAQSYAARMAAALESRTSGAAAIGQELSNPLFTSSQHAAAPISPEALNPLFTSSQSAAAPISPKAPNPLFTSSQSAAAPISPEASNPLFTSSQSAAAPISPKASNPLFTSSQSAAAPISSNSSNPLFTSSQHAAEQINQDPHPDNTRAVGHDIPLETCTQAHDETRQNLDADKPTSLHAPPLETSLDSVRSASENESPADASELPDARSKEANSADVSIQEAASPLPNVDKNFQATSEVEFVEDATQEGPSGLSNPILAAPQQASIISRLFLKSGLEGGDDLRLSERTTENSQRSLKSPGALSAPPQKTNAGGDAIPNDRSGKTDLKLNQSNHQKPANKPVAALKEQASQIAKPPNSLIKDSTLIPGYEWLPRAHERMLEKQVSTYQQIAQALKNTDETVEPGNEQQVGKRYVEQAIQWENEVKQKELSAEIKGTNVRRRRFVSNIKRMQVDLESKDFLKQTIRRARAFIDESIRRKESQAQVLGEARTFFEKRDCLDRPTNHLARPTDIPRVATPSALVLRDNLVEQAIELNKGSSLARPIVLSRISTTAKKTDKKSEDAAEQTTTGQDADHLARMKFADDSEVHAIRDYLAEHRPEFLERQSKVVGLTAHFLELSNLVRNARLKEEDEKHDGALTLSPLERANNKVFDSLHRTMGTEGLSKTEAHEARDSRLEQFDQASQTKLLTFELDRKSLRLLATNPHLIRLLGAHPQDNSEVREYAMRYPEGILQLAYLKSVGKGCTATWSDHNQWVDGVPPPPASLLFEAETAQPWLFEALQRKAALLKAKTKKEKKLLGFQDPTPPRSLTHKLKNARERLHKDVAKWIGTPIEPAFFVNGDEESELHSCFNRFKPVFPEVNLHARKYYSAYNRLMFDTELRHAFIDILLKCHPHDGHRFLKFPFDQVVDTIARIYKRPMWRKAAGLPLSGSLLIQLVQTELIRADEGIRYPKLKKVTIKSEASTENGRETTRDVTRYGSPKLYDNKQNELIYDSMSSSIPLGQRVGLALEQGFAQLKENCNWTENLPPVQHVYLNKQGVKVHARMKEEREDKKKVRQVNIDEYNGWRETSRQVDDSYYEALRTPLPIERIPDIYPNLTIEDVLEIAVRLQPRLIDVMKINQEKISDIARSFDKKESNPRLLMAHISLAQAAVVDKELRFKARKMESYLASLSNSIDLGRKAPNYLRAKVVQENTESLQHDIAYVEDAPERQQSRSEKYRALLYLVSAISVKSISEAFARYVDRNAEEEVDTLHSERMGSISRLTYASIAKVSRAVRIHPLPPNKWLAHAQPWNMKDLEPAASNASADSPNTFHLGTQTQFHPNIENQKTRSAIATNENLVSMMPLTKLATLRVKAMERSRRKHSKQERIQQTATQPYPFGQARRDRILMMLFAEIMPRPELIRWWTDLYKEDFALREQALFSPEQWKKYPDGCRRLTDQMAKQKVMALIDQTESCAPIAKVLQNENFFSNFTSFLLTGIHPSGQTQQNLVRPFTAPRPELNLADLANGLRDAVEAGIAQDKKDENSKRAVLKPHDKLKKWVKVNGIKAQTLVKKGVDSFSGTVGQKEEESELSEDNTLEDNTSVEDDVHPVVKTKKQKKAKLKIPEGDMLVRGKWGAVHLLNETQEQKEQREDEVLKKSIDAGIYSPLKVPMRRVRVANLVSDALTEHLIEHVLSPGEVQKEALREYVKKAVDSTVEWMESVEARDWVLARGLPSNVAGKSNSTSSKAHAKAEKHPIHLGESLHLLKQHTAALANTFAKNLLLNDFPIYSTPKQVKCQIDDFYKLVDYYDKHLNKLKNEYKKAAVGGVVTKGIEAVKVEIMKREKKKKKYYERHELPSHLIGIVTAQQFEFTSNPDGWLKPNTLERPAHAVPKRPLY